MKLGVFLITVAVCVTYIFFLPYFRGDPSVNFYGGILMWLIAFPCYYKGIKRIRRHRAKKKVQASTNEQNDKILL